MTSNRKMYTKAGILLSMILSMGAISFAGNTVSDIPTSPSENRTIQQTTVLYTGACDISQELAFYDKSPVFLRIAQPRGPVSYSFDKAETYVMVYGGNVFAGNLQFPYVSNMVPSTVIEPTTTTILTVEAIGSTFSGQASTPRNQIAGQIVTKNMERSLIVNANGATINYYYKRASDYSSHNGNMKALINANLTKKTACTNYYVARCGDGIVDKPTGTTDGNGGIQTQGGTFLAWQPLSTGQNESCDEGVLNGTVGHCGINCTGIGTGNGTGTNPTGPSCTLAASAATIEAGQSLTLSASYASGTSAIFSPSLTGITFTYPTRSNSNISDSPATTTTYSLTVNGESGTAPVTCTTTVTVTQPVPHLTCMLFINNGIPALTGQIVGIGWKVFNGSFVGTYIYVVPALLGAWPHAVNANQYNGITSVMATQTGDYIFSMMVNNKTEQYTCTGVLHVIDRIPSACSLSTTTPTITQGQTAILNAGYSNASLATFTPNIPGLNLVYPNRSNGAISVSPAATTTYTLTTLGVGGLSGSTCSTTVNVMNTGITLSKSLVTNILYHSGDLVSFTINFANNSPSTIHNVIVSDYLPAGLEYVSSQIFGVSPITFGVAFNGPSQFVEYSGFDLTAGQAGYLIVVGKFKGYQYSTQTLNNAFLKSDDSSLLYASALFNVYTPNGNASVVKTSNKASYALGEDARFTVAVTNNGPDPINTLAITDDRPNTPCIIADTQWTSNVPLTMTNSTDPFVWSYNGSLAVGQTIYLYLTGHVSNTQNCVANYINNAAITYTMGGTTKTGNAQPLNFGITAIPSAVMNFEKRIVQQGNTTGDPAVFELVYQNSGSVSITNYDIVDYRPGTLNFVSATPMPTTQTVTSGGMLLHWIFANPIAPNGSGKITINGTIK